MRILTRPETASRNDTWHGFEALAINQFPFRRLAPGNRPARLRKQCGRHSTQKPSRLRAALPPCRGTAARPVLPQETPLFVPAGTPDSSPPFQRWECDHDEPPSPVRDGRSLRKPEPLGSSSEDTVRDSVAPIGAANREQLVVTPLNRWAIVGCPCRDKAWTPRRSLLTRLQIARLAWDGPIGQSVLLVSKRRLGTPLPAAPLRRVKDDDGHRVAPAVSSQDSSHS